MVITVVVCIKSRKVYKKCLEPSLQKQTVRYRLIEAPVHLSLPASYNSIRNQLDTKYVAFIHQDLRMLENTWLERAEEFCDSRKFGVFGVAGKSWGGKCTGYIVHEPPSPKIESVLYYDKKYNAHLYGNTKGATCIQLSQTLDSMVLIIPVRIFKKRKFDERVTQAIGVDYCLSLKHHLNLDSYTLPLKSWHTPFRDPSYVHKFQRKKRIQKTNRLIKKKWKGKFNLIFHTIDIDVCPKCKINPCGCKKPFSENKTIRWGKNVSNK